MNPPTTMRPVAGGGAGYQDPAEAAGKSRGEYFYLAAMIVIGAADVAIFAQVIMIVLQSLNEILAWMLVAGFTASSLMMAHFAGRLLRDQRAGYGAAPTWMIWALGGVWAMLGIVIFAVRLMVVDSTSSGATAVGGIDESSTQLATAIMTLVLYLASGLVAGVGEYLTRNPLRAAYRHALRYYRKALRKLNRSQPPFERAQTVLQVHSEGAQREEQNYQAAKAKRLAEADELKRYAAVLIAAHLQSPSATDGMTLPDRRPLSFDSGRTLDHFEPEELEAGRPQIRTLEGVAQ